MAGQEAHVVKVPAFKTISIRYEDYIWCDKNRGIQSFADFLHAVLSQFREPLVQQ